MRSFRRNITETMKLFFTLVLSVFTALCGFSQIDFNNYQPLQSEGDIPDDFLFAFKSEATENIVRLENENRKVYKAKRRFILSSYDMISESLRSGDVLFGDPVTVYLNKVLDEILKDEPEVRSKVRAYVSKSGYTNAYCTPQGVILVNMGLLAKMKSEAELAFVLKHEISHFVENHGIEKVIERVQINRNGKHKFIPIGDRIQMMLERGQKNEFECDSLASEWMSKSDYRCDNGLSCLTLLLNTTLPFVEERFDYDFFNSADIRIPHFMFLDSVTPIDFEEEKMDKYSTHPNVRKRKAAFSRISSGSGCVGSKDFIVSESEFTAIKKIAQFEVINTRLREREFGEAIYSAAALLKKYPNNLFLERSIALSLYGLAKYASINDLHKAARSAASMQGESQQVHSLFRQLTKAQINVLAFKYLRKVQKLEPENLVIQSMIRNLVLDFPFHNVLPERIEEAQEMDFSADYSAFKSIADRREKIKKKRELQKSYEDFHLAYLKSEISDPTIQELFEEAKQYKKECDELDAMNSTEFSTNARKEYQRVIHNGLGINGSKIFILEPTVQLVKDKYKSQKSYLKSIDKTVRFEEEVKDFVQNEIKLNSEFLSSRDLQKSDLETFKAIQALKLWDTEKVYHSTDDIIPLSTQELNALKDIQYVCGIKIFTSRYGSTVYYFYVADIKTGKTIYEYQDYSSRSLIAVLNRVKFDLKVIAK